MTVRDGLYAASRCSRAWYTDARGTDRAFLAARRSVLVSAIDVWHAACVLGLLLTSALLRSNLGHLRRREYQENL